MSTASLMLSQRASDADVIQAAREGAAMFSGDQSRLWEAYVDRQLRALEQAVTHGVPSEALNQLAGHCVSLLDICGSGRRVALSGSRLLGVWAR